VENNNPLPPVTSFKLPDQNPSNSKSLFKAFSIEGITILLIVLILLFLNYFNILPISKSVGALSFLPHQAYQNAATTTNTTKLSSLLPTLPKFFSKKIADLSKPFGIIQTGNDEVVTTGDDIQSGGVSCLPCNTYEKIFNAYKDPETGNANVIGFKNGKYYFFHNGKESTPYQSYISGVFSSDGSRFAAIFSDNSHRQTVVVDGTEIGTYGTPENGNPIPEFIFSKNGASYAFSVAEGPSATEIGYVVVNGVAKKKYKSINGITFSDDGKHLAYIAYDGNQFVVKDDIESSIKAQWIGSPQVDQPMAFSPDGSKLAYIIGKGTQRPYDYVLIVNEKEVSTPHNGGVSRIVFSPDSKRLAYIARDITPNSDVFLLYLDNQNIDSNPQKTSTSYYGFDVMQFSPDGKNFVYEHNGTLYNQTKKPMSNTYKKIYNFTFSPNGERNAFTAVKNDSKVVNVIDNKEYAGYSPYRDIIFSSDSNNVAYSSTNSLSLFDYYAKYELQGKYTIAVNSKTTNEYTDYPTVYPESELFDNYGIKPYKLTFTKDGKYILYNAIINKEFWLIVRDTTTGKEIIDKNTVIPTDVPSTPTADSLSPTPSSSLEANFPSSNNTKRASDINAILNAIGQYAADNKGVLPNGIDVTTRFIQKSGNPTNDADICSALVPSYLAALPVDPLTNNGTPILNCSVNYNTNYTVARSPSDNRITIAAPAAELGQTISVNR